MTTATKERNARLHKAIREMTRNLAREEAAAPVEPEKTETVIHQTPETIVFFQLPVRLAWTIRKLGFTECAWDAAIAAYRENGETVIADTIEGNVDDLRAYLADNPPEVLRPELKLA